MKICKVTVLNRTKENTVFEVTYKNFWGVYNTRKGYHKGTSSLCYWLDNDMFISPSSNIIAILDLGVDEFFILPATN